MCVLSGYDFSNNTNHVPGETRMFCFVGGGRNICLNIEVLTQLPFSLQGEG